MAATLDFTSFFTMAFLGAAPFFTAWLFLIRYILLFSIPTGSLFIGATVTVIVTYVYALRLFNDVHTSLQVHVVYGWA